MPRPARVFSTAASLALAVAAAGIEPSAAQPPGAPTAPTVEIVGNRSRVAFGEAPAPGAPVPAWVEFADPDIAGLGDQPWRLVERHLRVRNDGESTFLVRHVIDIADRSVLDEAAILEVSVRPEFETLTLHQLRVWRDGSWGDRLVTSRTVGARRERALDQATLDGRASHLVILDDLRLGDRLELIWSIRGRDPALLGHYAGGLRLDDGPSVARSILRVVVDPGVTLSYRASGGLPGPRHLEDGSLEWELVPPPTTVSLPEDLPGETAASVVPRIQLTTFGSWEEVATWAAQLYQPTPPPPELIAVAEGIAAGSARRDERILAALQWVQREIRYFAVHLDEHTLRPHPLNEVLARRYGDCKDQAALLAQLLNLVGIAARPLLVDATTPGSARASLPSPAPFDHVIVMLEDQTQFFDPTVDAGPVTSLAEVWIPRYEIGLPALPQHGLVEIPAALSAEGTLEVASSYRFGADATFELAIDTRQTGQLAREQREILANGVEDLGDQYLAWYERPDVELTAEPLAIDDPGAPGPLTLRERYVGVVDDPRAPRRLLPLEIEAVLPVPADDRQLGLQLPLPRQHHEVVTIAAPAGWQLPLVNATIENPWFTFRAGSSAGAGEAQLDFHLQTSGAAVAAEDLERYRHDLAALAATLSYEAIPATGWQRLVRPVALGALGVLAALLLFSVARRSRHARS